MGTRNRRWHGGGGLRRRRTRSVRRLVSSCYGHEFTARARHHTLDTDPFASYRQENHTRYTFDIIDSYRFERFVFETISRREQYYRRLVVRSYDYQRRLGGNPLGGVRRRSSSAGLSLPGGRGGAYVPQGAVARWGGGDYPRRTAAAVAPLKEEFKGRPRRNAEPPSVSGGNDGIRNVPFLWHEYSNNRIDFVSTTVFLRRTHVFESAPGKIIITRQRTHLKRKTDGKAYNKESLVRMGPEKL